MSEQLFFQWLQRSLSVEGRHPVSFEGLSTTEVVLAKQVEESLAKADNLKQYSSIFLQTLDSRERFSEVAIGALSASIKIGHLGETIRNINVFCKRIVEIFTHELGFENCSILLKRDDSGQLRPVATRSGGGKRTPSGNKNTEFNSPIVKNIAQMVAGSGDYIFIPDVFADSRFANLADMSIGITSLLSAPMRSGSDILGVINCSHPIPGAFDENKINLILLLSNFAGQVMTLIALSNKISEWNEGLRKEVEKKTAELRRKNAKLHKLAVTDALTGLFNRRFFFTRLEEEFSRTLRYDEHFALLAIDIDNLKAINDNCGHVAGDKIIRHISECLKTSGRKGDVIGRLGGDEFGYIMLNADEKNARHLSSRLQESVARVAFKGMDEKPTVSIGIAATGSHNFKKYQDIYKAADSALYISKNRKNCISVFGEESKRKTSKK